MCDASYNIANLMTLCKKKGGKQNIVLSKQLKYNGLDGLALF